jgi:hypothetical protein
MTTNSTWASILYRQQIIRIFDACAPGGALAMGRIAILLTALFFTPVFMECANAATGGFQSGRSGSAMSGARTFRPGGSGILHGRIPHTGIPRTGIPHSAIPRGEFPRFGNTHRDFARRRFRGGIGTGVVIGAPLLEPIDPFLYDTYGYPYGVSEYEAPYPPEVYAAPQPVLPPAAVYAPPDGQAPSQLIWYYCQNPMGYYPTVQDCNTDWQTVPGSVLPPPDPQQ